MKWRDRISILSRKRTHKTFIPPVQDQNLPSGSGTGNSIPQSLPETTGSSVENTLSQIRPVIGPDHKSYYILLRGSEDSFTCIQPAKDTIDSLDDVVKNVVNSVKLTKQSQERELPPAAKKPRYSQGKTYKSTNRQNTRSRINGVLNSQIQISDEERTETAVGLDNLFLSRTSPEDTSNVVENVVLNQRVPNVNSEQQGKMMRTSTLLYPLVQSSRLAQGSAVRSESRQKHCLLLPSESVNEDESQLLVPTESELIQNITQSCNSGKVSNQKQTLTTVNQVEEQELCDPSDYVTTEMKDFNNILPPLGQSSSPTELCLIAREGTLLSEEEITSQIKTMIESEQLIVGEGKQIVVIRVSPREAVVKIVGNEAEPPEQQEQRETPESFHAEHQQVSDVSVVKEEICYDPEVVISNNNNNSSSINNNHEDGVEYLLSPYQECITKREIENDASYVVESFIDSSLQEGTQDDRLEYGDMNTVADPLLTGTEKDGEIVVFQREDGAFVNQDGTPVSSELQYLIATSQQDFASPIEQSYSMFTSSGSFDHQHSIDVNTGL